MLHHTTRRCRTLFVLLLACAALALPAAGAFAQDDAHPEPPGGPKLMAGIVPNG